MKKILYLAAFIMFLLCNLPAFADPFSDVPSGHWSYDAVQILEEKGLVEGYPDGLFKGDRPMTRYEMAMVVARIVAKLEQVQASIPGMPDLSVYATKSDMEILDKLLKEYKKELDALGVRVSNIEDTMGKLTSRVSELERIKVSGTFSNVFCTIGYSPGASNTAGPGTPSGNHDGTGPSVIPDQDRYFLGRTMYQGSAVTSKLDLTVTAKIADNIKGGGDFVAWSGFGEKGLAEWDGLMPPYNPLGSGFAGGTNYKVDLATLWFKTEGDWNISGKFGDYRLSKVSKNLFAGPRSLYVYGGALLLPINGINVSGTLYKTVDIEAFMARNINASINFDYPSPVNPLYYYGGPGYSQSNWSWYPLATPYNNGAGASHVYSYEKISPGQYDNYLYGVYGGYSFLEGKARVEGGYLNLFEDFASNPDVASARVNPKGAYYYGVNGYYTTGEKNKVKISAEFNQTSFNYNLRDTTHVTQKGSYFIVGADVDMEPVKFSGKFIRIDANYDPFSYHYVWDKVYLDGHHDSWTNWKYGSFENGTRWGKYRPNRIGFNAGFDWFFGGEKEGQAYVDYTYIKQLHPTLITSDENSFQKYDLLTGLPVADTIGANIYGNQESLNMFTVNDPAEGKEYHIGVGGKYTFNKKLHIWGMYDRYNFSRDFTWVHLNAANQAYNHDITMSFVYTGVTYDVTDKFSVQGNFAYAKGAGVEEKGTSMDFRQVIPGVSLRYAFNDSSDFIVDYKYFNYVDNITAGAKDYNANRLTTRLVVKF